MPVYLLLFGAVVVEHHRVKRSENEWKMTCGNREKEAVEVVWVRRKTADAERKEKPDETWDDKKRNQRVKER